MLPVILLLLLPAVGLAAYPTRGYQARASGMDFEHDGTFNTAICDGSDSSADEDIDGAGYARDDQCYVDCTSGTDGTSCGSPSSPCRTIQYCVSNSNTGADARWRIGTAETAQIQAVCIKGTCVEETVDISTSGAAGTVTVSATGSQVRSFEYPRYPLVIMGWDADGDNDYPPNDAGDTAELDNNSLAGYTFTLPSDNDRIEIAHLTIKEYGYEDNNAGILDPNTNYTLTSHLYLHDMQWTSICDYVSSNNSAPHGNSGCITIDAGANAEGNIDYLAVENINMTYQGGWLFRGVCPMGQGVECTPARFQNLSYLGRIVDNEDLDIVRIWGAWSGVEFLDSDFDSGCGNTHACSASGFVLSGFDLAQCNVDFVLRNNKWTNWKVPINMQGSYDFCSTDPRDMTDIVIDANEFVTTHAFTPTQAIFSMSSDGDTNKAIDALRITNNIIRDTQNVVDIGIHCMGGMGSTDGPRIFANNTISGGAYPATYGVIYLDSGCGSDWTITNNIITGISATCRNIYTDYDVTDFSADTNIYDSDCSYVWSGGTSRTVLADWQSDSGADANSTESRTVTFVSASDLHLSASDTGAIDYGTSLVSYFTTDYDGQTRSGTWDIGADEYLACHGDRY